MSDPIGEPGEHIAAQDLSAGSADEDQTDLAEQDTAPREDRDGSES